MFWLYYWLVFNSIYFRIGYSLDLSSEINKTGHYCNVNVPIRESVSASCFSMTDLFLKGYDLDYEAMKLNSVDLEQLEKYMNTIINMASEDQIEIAETRKSSRDCVFYRVTTRQDRLCCEGWVGSNCDEPICSIGCYSNSKCVGANECHCADGYSGKFCQEKKQTATKDKAFCYKKLGCYGSLLLGPKDSDILKGSGECCATGGLEGQSWGSLDGDCISCKIGGRNLTSVFSPQEILDKSKTSKSCNLWGGTFIETFGEQIIESFLSCDFDLVESSYFNISVLMEGCLPCNTCPKKLLVSLSKPVPVVFELLNGSISFAGRSTFISSINGYSSTIYGIDITKNGDFYNLTAGDLAVSWDGQNIVRIQLASPKFMVRGLCGSISENPPFNTELSKRDGSPLDTIESFVNSWITEKSKNTGCTNGLLTDGCNNNDLIYAKNNCSQLLMEPFASCHQQVDYSVYFEDCVQKLCSCNSAIYLPQGRLTATSTTEIEERIKGVICQSLEAYAYECAKWGNQFTWRNDETCPIQCPHGMIYSNCAPSCSRSCSNILSAALKISDPCHRKKCTPGCSCPSGTFLDHEEKCVAAAKCSCEMRGQRYPPMSYVTINCNKCQCKNGNWECGKVSCPKTCYITNERRVITFDGVKYEFNPLGEGCQYTVVEMKDEVKFANSLVNLVSINIGFDYCQSNKFYNCTRFLHATFNIQSAVVDIELKTDYSVLINGEIFDLSSYSSPRVIHDIIKIWKTSEQIIILEAADIIINFGGLGWNSVILGSHYHNQIRGLCSNMDGIIEQEFISRQNIEEHVTNFVQSYSTCSTESARPSTYDPCENIDATRLSTLRNECNSLFNSTLFQSCSSLIDRRQFIEGCVTDYCANPSDYGYPCNLLSIYSTMCAERGSLVEWSKDPIYKSLCTELPGFVCGHTSYYTDCLSTTFPVTCAQLSSSNNASQSNGEFERICFAGCQCSLSGHVFDENGDCVEVSKCPCKHPTTGRIEKSGTEFIKLCKKCKCSSGAWTCISLANCTLESQCPANQIYSTTHNVCQRQCSNLDVVCPNQNLGQYFEGCGCPDGLVALLNKTCVLPTLCPCQYNGQSYNGGDKISIGCSIYTCLNRKWSVKKISSCRKTCSTYGGLHYKSFDGQTFTVDVRVDCETVLLRMRHLEIVARNIPCGEAAIICSKAIFIGYSQYKLRLLRDVSPIINGESVEVKGVIKFGGGVIRSTDLFVIVSLDNGLDLLWDYGTRVQITITEDLRKEPMEGLCELTSSLTPYSDKSSYLNYVMCNSTTVLKDADPCKGDEERALWSKTACDIIRIGSVFETCRQNVQITEEYYQNCMTDACTCRLGEDCQCLCTAISAFAMQCNQHGIYPEWRSNHLCPVMCSNGKVYHSCRTPCHLTCQNLNDLPDRKCHELDCVEGCYCPDGTVENEKGECVKEEDCRCLMDHQFYNPHAIIQKECKTCICERGQFECIENESCLRECTIDEFKCIIDSKCIKNKLKCDNIPDCADKSDELDCNFNKTCDFGEFLCDNDICMSNFKRCDHIQDCDDAKDELDCDRKCDQDQFLCSNRRCIAAEQVCDFYYDCGIDDNTDEFNCTIPPNCASGIGFSCISKEACYPSHVVCDGVDDCGDGSDENQCDYLDKKSGVEICDEGLSIVMLDKFHDGFLLSYAPNIQNYTGLEPKRVVRSIINSTSDLLESQSINLTNNNSLFLGEEPYPWKSRLGANNSRLYVSYPGSNYFGLARISFEIVGKGDTTILLMQNEEIVDQKSFESEKYVLWESARDSWNVSSIIIEIKSDWLIELTDIIVIGCVSREFKDRTLDECKSYQTIDYKTRRDVVMTLSIAGKLVSNNPVDILKNSPSIDAPIIPFLEIGTMYTLKIRILAYCPSKITFREIQFKTKNLLQALLSVENQVIWVKRLNEGDDQVVLTPQVLGDYILIRFMSNTGFAHIYDLEIRYCCTTEPEIYNWPSILKEEIAECFRSASVDVNRQITFDLAQIDDNENKVKRADQILESRPTAMHGLNGLNRVNIFVEVLQPCPELWHLGLVHIKLTGAKELIVHRQDGKIFSLSIPISDKEFIFSTSLNIDANNFTLTFIASSADLPALTLSDFNIELTCACEDTEKEESEEETTLMTTQYLSKMTKLATDEYSTNGKMRSTTGELTTPYFQEKKDGNNLDYESTIGQGYSDQGSSTATSWTELSTKFTTKKHMLGFTLNTNVEDSTSQRSTMMSSTRRPLRKRISTTPRTSYRSCRRRDWLLIDYETDPNLYNSSLIASNGDIVGNAKNMLSGSQQKYQISLLTTRKHKISLKLNEKCPEKWWLKQLQFKFNCNCQFNISVSDNAGVKKIIQLLKGTLTNPENTVIWTDLTSVPINTDLIELDIIRFDDTTAENITDFEARFCCDKNTTSTSIEELPKSEDLEYDDTTDYEYLPDNYYEDPTTSSPIFVHSGCASVTKSVTEILHEVRSNCVPENQTAEIESCEGSCNGSINARFDHILNTFTIKNSPCTCCQGSIKTDIQFNLICEQNGLFKNYTGIFQNQSQCNCKKCSAQSKVFGKYTTSHINMPKMIPEDDKSDSFYGPGNEPITLNLNENTGDVLPEEIVY